MTFTDQKMYSDLYKSFNTYTCTTILTRHDIKNKRNFQEECKNWDKQALKTII